MNHSRSATNSEATVPTLGRPLGWLFNLFSSVWTGIVLLILLFSYSSIGSVPRVGV